tara:strand:+ start:13 stop:570 length:558 start_codon:yes stop_codon:yes gene_type:complete
MVSILIKIKFFIFIIFIYFSTFSFAEEITVPEDAHSIDILGKYINAPIIEENTIGDARIALVSFTALIEENNIFSGSFIDCKLAAHAAPGRGGFSCGFAQMENVNGYCIITDTKGDSLVSKLECSSGATMTQNVRCEGRLDFISGTGRFAGASGFARLNMDQIFTISNEQIQFTGYLKLPALTIQ